MSDKTVKKIQVVFSLVAGVFFVRQSLIHFGEVAGFFYLALAVFAFFSFQIGFVKLSKK